jgi:REP element-mobilizing transposase RayT/DNA-binding response OmpR family regulator
MTWSVLVATPHPTFGELLRLSLEESGDYQISQVESGQQALAATNGKVLALAILDSDLADLPFSDLVQSLHSQHPGMRLIVIPPENDHAHPSLAEIKPDACLSRPFYLPDMLYTVKTVMSTSDLMAEEKPLPEKPATSPAFASYAWQTDSDQAARQLAEMLVESSAHAALMMKDGQIWAFTGSLDRVASLEIAAILARYLDNAEKSDLARFVRLNSTKIEYMVYATALVEDLVLALIFDASTPLTHIRSQVIRLARSLKQTEAQARPAPTPPALADEKSPSKRVEVFDQPDTGFEYSSAGEEDETAFEESTQISLAELLANMPSPDPTIKGSALEDWMLDPNPRDEAESNPPAPDPAAVPAATPQSHPPEPLSQAKPVAIPESAPISDQLPPAPGSNLVLSEDDSLADTQPLVLQPLNRLTDLESVSASYSRLTYTCLMIPRMPHHYLAGELAEHLGQWFPQCCLAFGWRLEGLSIRPEYVQWMVEVSPTISPGNMIRILRQRTSQYIFNQYSLLKNENPSGDFWAPGYLIVSGSQPPTIQMRREFVDESRRRQGLLR